MVKTYTYTYVLHDNPSTTGTFESDWDCEACDDNMLELIGLDLMKYIWKFELHLHQTFPVKATIWTENLERVGTFNLRVKFNPKFICEKIKEEK